MFPLCPIILYTPDEVVQMEERLYAVLDILKPLVAHYVPVAHTESFALEQLMNPRDVLTDENPMFVALPDDPATSVALTTSTGRQKLYVAVVVLLFAVDVIETTVQVLGKKEFEGLQKASVLFVVQLRAVMFV